VVVGALWLATMTFAAFRNTWFLKVPGSDVYYRHDQCMELEKGRRAGELASGLPRPTDVFDAIYAESQGTPDAFDRAEQARKAREESKRIVDEVYGEDEVAAAPRPTSVFDRIRAEKAKEAREKSELLAGIRDAEAEQRCVAARLAVADSRSRFSEAAAVAAVVGLGVPLTILAIGHGIAWALRGLLAGS